MKKVITLSLILFLSSIPSQAREISDAMFFATYMEWVNESYVKNAPVRVELVGDGIDNSAKLLGYSYANLEAVIDSDIYKRKVWLKLGGLIERYLKNSLVLKQRSKGWSDAHTERLTNEVLQIYYDTRKGAGFLILEATTGVKKEDKLDFFKYLESQLGVTVDVRDVILPEDTNNEEEDPYDGQMDADETEEDGGSDVPTDRQDTQADTTFNPEALHLKFFKSSGTQITRNKRVYKTRFQNSNTRAIHFELKLRYEKLKRDETFLLKWMWYKPDGSFLTRKSREVTLKKGRESSHHAGGWLYKSYGKWMPGKYRVEVYVNRQRVANEHYVVVDDGASNNADPDPSDIELDTGPDYPRNVDLPAPGQSASSHPVGGYWKRQQADIIVSGSMRWEEQRPRFRGSFKEWNIKQSEISYQVYYINIDENRLIHDVRLSVKFDNPPLEIYPGQVFEIGCIGKAVVKGAPVGDIIQAYPIFRNSKGFSCFPDDWILINCGLGNSSETYKVTVTESKGQDIKLNFGAMNAPGHVEWNYLWVDGPENVETENEEEDYDIPSLKAKVTGLVFFESAKKKKLNRNERKRDTVFEKSETRTINFELGLMYPRVDHNRVFKMEMRWYGPDGRVINKRTRDATIKAGKTYSYHCSAIGHEQPDKWKPGEYRLVIAVNGQDVASSKFSIVDAIITRN